jgi:diacylglycerol kinase family enzyme
MTQRGSAGPGVAVLLNAHAKRVTPGVRSAIDALVGPENVFLSQEISHAEAIAACVVDAGYRTVFAAGGDGTFVGWVNRFVAIAERTGRPLPRFGILALGTGNALAAHLGTSAERWLEDLRRYVRGEVTGLRRLDLVDCEGHHTPFAGAGADAAVIGDYDRLRRALRGTPLEGFALGPPGFALAASLGTIPRALYERIPSCEVVNAGEPAWRLGDDGERAGEPIPPGGTLYAGPCTLAAASTVPYYGLGMRAFPFAGRTPGKFHLRVVGQVPVPVIVAGLHQIWTGAFRHPGLHDFEADGVTVRFDRPVPLQLGGDPAGLRDAFTMRAIAEPIEVVDFSGAPAPADHRA